VSGFENKILLLKTGAGKNKPYKTGSAVTDYIYKVINEYNRCMLACIVGNVGTGKSYTAMKIALSVDPTFNIDRVIFSTKDFFKVLNSGELTKGKAIMFDELQISQSSRRWYSELNQMLNEVLTTFRHRNLFCIFTVPHWKFVDSHTRNLFHLVIKTTSPDLKKKVVPVQPFFLTVENMGEKSLEPYKQFLRVQKGNTQLVCSRLSVSKPPEDLCRAYEERARSFKTGLVMDRGKKLNKEFVDMNLSSEEEKVLALIKQKKAKKKIAEEVGITAYKLNKVLDSLDYKGHVW